MSRARIEGHDGLPRYPWATTFPAQLATETMLRAMRRRLAPEQKRAAWYGTPYGDRALYLIADSVELPPLVGKRAEAYTAARTCARCAGTTVTPLYRYADRGQQRRRLHVACRRAETDAAGKPKRYRDRRAAVAWAAGVLADGQAVVLANRGPSGAQPHRRIYASTLTGQVLFDVSFLDPAEVADVVGPLNDRPLITWASKYPLYEWVDGPSVQAVELYHRRASWAPDVEPGHLTDGHPGATVGFMIDLIRRMAQDDHPDGPPGGCPVLGQTGIEPCGEPLTETGHCVEHRRPYLVEVLARFTAQAGADAQ